MRLRLKTATRAVKQGQKSTGGKSFEPKAACAETKLNWVAPVMPRQNTPTSATDYLKEQLAKKTVARGAESEAIFSP